MGKFFWLTLVDNNLTGRTIIGMTDSVIDRSIASRLHSGLVYCQPATDHLLS